MDVEIEGAFWNRLILGNRIAKADRPDLGTENQHWSNLRNLRSSDAGDC